MVIANFSITVVMGQEYLPNRLGLASGITLGAAIGVGGLAAAALGALADHTSLTTTLWVIALIPFPAFLIALTLPPTRPRLARLCAISRRQEQRRRERRRPGGHGAPVRQVRRSSPEGAGHGALRIPPRRSRSGWRWSGSGRRAASSTPGCLALTAVEHDGHPALPRGWERQAAFQSRARPEIPKWLSV